jgi:hypothetical protein
LEREYSGLQFGASRAWRSKALKSRENLKSQVFTPWLVSFGRSAQGYTKLWREKAAGATWLGPSLSLNENSVPRDVAPQNDASAEGNDFLI